MKKCSSSRRPGAAAGVDEICVREVNTALASWPTLAVDIEVDSKREAAGPKFLKLYFLLFLDIVLGFHSLVRQTFQNAKYHDDTGHAAYEVCCILTMD